MCLTHTTSPPPHPRCVRYKSVFGSNYYLEVMDHGRPENVRINQCIHQLSQEMVRHAAQ